MMTRNEVFERLRKIKKWQSGDVRAPHKPLLLLMYLTRLANGIKAPLPFSKVEEPLRELLQEFGPPRKSYHPEEPFARLTNDGIWILDKSVITTGSISISELREVDPAGQLSPELLHAFESNRGLLEECIELLLEDNFPESIHEEIKSALGYTTEGIFVRRSKRDASFRHKVLLAYEYSCAVCGFNLRIKHAPAGVEAAHIRWHAMNGPDEVSNGLALCTMHHKLFDLGAMTVNSNIQVVVSSLTNGTGKEWWLTPFEGKEIRRPQAKYPLPEEAFLSWHEKEVFKW